MKRALLSALMLLPMTAAAQQQPRPPSEEAFGGELIECVSNAHAIRTTAIALGRQVAELQAQVKQAQDELAKAKQPVAPAPAAP